MRRIFVLLLLLAIHAHLSPALSETAVIGPDGTTYRLVESSDLGSLMVEPETPSETPGKAIAVEARGQTPTFVALPVTPELGSVGTVFLELDDQSSTLFAVWEERSDEGPSMLRMASLRDGNWLEQRDLTGLALWIDGSLEMILSPSQYLDAQFRQHDRSVIHLIWREDSGGGERQVYLPIILLDGEIVGSGPLVNLDEVVPEGSAEPGAPYREGPRATRVLGLRDGSGGLVAFTSELRQRLIVAEIRAIPAALSALPDRLWEFLSALDSSACEDFEGGAPWSLVGQVRAHIIDTGFQSDSRIGGYAAGRLEGLLLDFAPSLCEAGGVELFAQNVKAATRGMIEEIESGNGLLRGESPAIAITVGDPTPQTDWGGAPTRILVRKIADYPLPPTQTDAAYLHLVEGGDRIIVSWPTDETLEYMEIGEGVWGEARELGPAQGWNLDEVRLALDRRLR